MRYVSQFKRVWCRTKKVKQLNIPLAWGVRSVEAAAKGIQQQHSRCGCRFLWAVKWSIIPSQALGLCFLRARNSLYIPKRKKKRLICAFTTWKVDLFGRWEVSLPNAALLGRTQDVLAKINNVLQLVLESVETQHRTVLHRDCISVLHLYYSCYTNQFFFTPSIYPDSPHPTHACLFFNCLKYEKNTWPLKQNEPHLSEMSLPQRSSRLKFKGRAENKGAHQAASVPHLHQLVLIFMSLLDHLSSPRLSNPPL